LAKGLESAKDDAGSVKSDTWSARGQIARKALLVFLWGLLRSLLLVIKFLWGNSRLHLLVKGLLALNAMCKGAHVLKCPTKRETHNCALSCPLSMSPFLAGERQTLLFSATFPKEIQRLAADFMHDYIFLSVGRVGSSTDLIVQHVEYISPNEKRNVLLDLINTVEVSALPIKPPLAAFCCPIGFVVLTEGRTKSWELGSWEGVGEGAQVAWGSGEGCL